MVFLLGRLCFLHNLLRACIHRGTSSMSARSHAYASRHDQRFAGAPRVRLNDAILQPRLPLHPHPPSTLTPRKSATYVLVAPHFSPPSLELVPILTPSP